MSLPLPRSLSPSKVSSFKDCALAFRLSAIDGLPEPPTLPAAKGTVVHRTLELLFWEEDQGHRSLSTAMAKLERAVEEVLGSAEYADLGLGPEERDELVADARDLVGRYYQLEDPDGVRVLGTELMLAAPLGSLPLRGIIDRLELDGDGELVVTDYKTGRAPAEGYEQDRLAGVHFYAYLCEEVFGRRPARIQLLHLREPMAITATPTTQSTRGFRQQASAIWRAVERACEAEDFRPRPGRACAYCGFHAYCPAMGGTLDAMAPVGEERGAPPSPAVGAVLGAAGA